MFCENCGSDNVPGAKFCASCGAPLKSVQSEPNGYPQESYQQDIYRQDTYQQDIYPQSQGYYQPQSVVRAPQATRSAGAIVLYMIAGAIALLSILMVFLPQVKVWGVGANTFQIITNTSFVYSLFNSRDAEIIGVVLIAFFVIPMILQLVWAILSFARVRAAGVLGLIASIISINVTFYWAVVLKLASRNMTSVPYFMVALSIAGLVLSIIQLTKKNRVR